MRYSLLNTLACPVSKEPLVLVAATEANVEIPVPYIDRARRVSQPGVAVGPLAEGVPAGGSFAELLAQHATALSDPNRNEQVVIREGILVAPSSGRWYPIIDEIPEVLPDSLRDFERDVAFLDGYASSIPAELMSALRRSTDSSDRATKPGDTFKVSEITLLDKVENRDLFLSPGLYSPFNPGAFFHSSELIRGFSVCIPFLRLDLGAYVLDSGSGYSWTTEWFMKMGVTAVGVEISRTYLDVGRRRMGANQPHLVIADVENLPFQDGVFNAVLGFDAFHHIPDRSRAMAGYVRALKEQGRIVLVEPGSAHENAPAAQWAMTTFGTLEVGMELSDVRGYIEGLPNVTATEMVVQPIDMSDPRNEISLDALRDRSFVGWCLYVVEKTPASVS